jgi:hypothetical protein
MEVAGAVQTRRPHWGDPSYPHKFEQAITTMTDVMPVGWMRESKTYPELETMKYLAI